MCLAQVVNKGVRENTGAYNSGVSEILGVCKVARNMKQNMCYELVMIICIERCKYEYVSIVVNLNM